MGTIHGNNMKHSFSELGLLWLSKTLSDHKLDDQYRRASAILLGCVAMFSMGFDILLIFTKFPYEDILRSVTCHITARTDYFSNLSMKKSSIIRYFLSKTTPSSVTLTTLSSMAELNSSEIAPLLYAIVFGVLLTLGDVANPFLYLLLASQRSYNRGLDEKSAIIIGLPILLLKDSLMTIFTHGIDLIVVALGIMLVADYISERLLKGSKFDCGQFFIRNAIAATLASVGHQYSGVTSVLIYTPFIISLLSLFPHFVSDVKSSVRDLLGQQDDHKLHMIIIAKVMIVLTCRWLSESLPALISIVETIIISAYATFLQYCSAREVDELLTTEGSSIDLRMVVAVSLVSALIVSVISRGPLAVALVALFCRPRQLYESAVLVTQPDFHHDFMGFCQTLKQHIFQNNTQNAQNIETNNNTDILTKLVQTPKLSKRASEDLKFSRKDFKSDSVAQTLSDSYVPSVEVQQEL